MPLTFHKVANNEEIDTGIDVKHLTDHKELRGSIRQAMKDYISY